MRASALFWTMSWLICGVAPLADRVAAGESADVLIADFAQATSALSQACSDCHSADAEEGGFSLEELADAQSLSDHFERWQRVRQRIADHSMPPADSAPLDAATRDQLDAWIHSASLAAVCGSGPAAGPPMLRRMTRYEYANTIRDLLNIHFDASQGLPEDGAGGEGFSNAAETLTISPIHAEKYLQAAIDALDYAARDESARGTLLVPVGAEGDEDAAASESLKRLAERAFRRAVRDADLEPWKKLYRDARSDGLEFDQAVFYAMRAILISAEFLFLTEAAPAQIGTAEPLTDHELATRLSYFLWASTPDDDLRKAADQGQLQDSEELAKQTLRLIKARGTHLQDSLEQFIGQWLGTADVGRSKQVDPQRHGWIEEPHVEALRKQPVVAFESILQENDSLLDLIDCDWTCLNDDLVRVYGLKKGRIEGKFVQRLVRVPLPEEYRYRAGLLGMGGVMVTSSYPRRSSPVLRGAWVLEKLLGVQLPAPPPSVPSLNDSSPAAEAMTLRQRLLEHRADPACATCHDRIDPLGFALENFDELGRWRDKDEGGSIDPVARLADGTEIDGIDGLKQWLLAKKTLFLTQLTRKMLGYALGRALRPTDLCAVESIVKQVEADEYRSQTLVLGIVSSTPFRMKAVQQSELR